MQKTVNIGGKDVNFKFTLAAFYIFKNQFGYDAMVKVIPTLGEILSDLSFQEIVAKDGDEAMLMDMLISSLDNVYSFEMVDLLNMLWSFAKAGDPSIGDPMVWYNQFDEFPICDVLKEIGEPLLRSIGAKKKLKTIQITEKKETKEDKKEK